MSDLPTKILLATDGSASSASAAHRAAGMAHAFGAELRVVHVMPVTQPYHLVGTDAEEPSLYEEDKQWAQELLDEQVRKIEESGATVEEAHLGMGIPAGRAIVHLGEELGAGIVVAGSRGRGPMRRAVMGSVSDSVVRHAHCPVMVVRR
jgi:nucleotide-binding universal stress UspA family protein